MTSRPPPDDSRTVPHTWLRRLLMTAAAFVAACATGPTPPVTGRPPDAVNTPLPGVAPAPVIPAVPVTPSYSPAPSAAATPRDYRRDGASHIYALNANRVFKGKLPPLLYAIGVLQVEVDRQGKVTSMSWMRAPRHAPEVVAEIERTVRAAAPFPVPTRLGRVTYTDTWLWDKSGRFQLDTLTEGQRSEL